MSATAAEPVFSELVFAFVYPVGTNPDPVISLFENHLAQYGYESHNFRISNHLSSLNLGISVGDTTRYDRADALIKAGNEARRISQDNGILAVMAITDIASRRELDEQQRPVANPHTAHLVRSLKRPEEVALFREVYRSGFYLVGIANDEDSQIEYLTRELGMTRQQAEKLMERDQNEQLPNGQRTRDTFYLADVFIQASEAQYKSQVDRFLELVFGHPFKTPSREEHAMFLAYASAARSAQLGRQVGAAITTPEGDVLAVGMNEVPSLKGGVYWEGDSDDCRDHKREIDSNAEHRSFIIKSICGNLTNDVISSAAIMELVNRYLRAKGADPGFEMTAGNARTELGRPEPPSLIDPELAYSAIESSDLRSITEYGRAVHGEMDAILTCARLGIRVSGCYLYVTTFPCHNCTRHIIASGIRRVYYVEPYPKSKARDLHSDAICFDEKHAAKSGKIPFLPFVGIGPRRYLDFFSLDLSSGGPVQRKGEDHRPLDPPKKERPPRVSLIPLSFLEQEDKLLNDYEDVLRGLRGVPRATKASEPDTPRN
jgi:deoxycytidylate deaminase